MKRAWLAILILSAGITVFCSLRNGTANARQELATQSAASQTRARQLALFRVEKQQVLERLRETKRLLAAPPPLPALAQLAEKILSGAPLQNLSTSESEQLLAELGFNWSTTGDYLMVSKKSLDGISFDGIKGVKLTTAARETLAITPAEQAAIETMTSQLADARAAWAKEHVQRTAPSGNVLAQYSLPVDAKFSQSQLAIFTNGIMGTLGGQRGQWLQDHSAGWMDAVGLRTGQDISKIPAEVLSTMPASAFEAQPTTLTVERYKAGEEWQIQYSLKQAGNGMSTSVLPRQPFPEAFRAVFPGGWRELAEIEGFELPKEFNKVQISP